MAERRGWIDPGTGVPSVRRPCELLGLHRSNLYYEPVPESVEDLRLMRLIDEEYLRHPFVGSRRMVLWLITQYAICTTRLASRPFHFVRIPFLQHQTSPTEPPFSLSPFKRSENP